MTRTSLPTTSRHQRDYSPVHWINYFDEAHDIQLHPNGSQQEQQQEINAITTTIDNEQTTASCSNGTNSFRVYMKNFNHPYAPQRQAGQRLDPQRIEVSESELASYSRVPTLVALHGGGYSGLTWSQFTRHIEQHCQCRILAIDLRGHGDTKTLKDEQMDIDTLVSDVTAVCHAAHQLCGFYETPKIVLIGHSMGGAIAVKCSTNCQDSLPSLAGFVIIDVVEGTAKEALPLMMSVIKTRPTRFPSLCNAIEWSVRSGMAKNSDAARVSMPSNLVNIESGQLAIHDVPVNDCKELLDSAVKYGANGSTTPNSLLQKHTFSISLDQLIGPSLPTPLQLPKGPLPPRIAALRGSSEATTSLSLVSTRNAISEEETEETQSVDSETTRQSNDNVDADGYKRPPVIEKKGYTWRTNLAKTQPFWNGWFDGLSEQLLSAPVQGKFLLLAGIDRLDKSLTIGHMQGRFMMKVLPKCGHAVHEDVPEQVALAIGDFLVRNKFACPVEGQVEIRAPLPSC